MEQAAASTRRKLNTVPRLIAFTVPRLLSHSVESKVNGAAHPASSSKMILLDPDLDSHPAPRKTAAMGMAASAPMASQRTLRLPAASTLTRFLKLAQDTVRVKGQVTVLLTTGAAIRKLNRRFRGKNKTTDVLSFPAEGIGAEEIAGDLAISVPTAMKQAIEQGHSLSMEIKVLILHGLLHLAGYDHEVDEGQMARRERLLRARLNLPQGLIERAENAVSQKLLIPSVRSEAERVEGPVVHPAKLAIKPRAGKPRISSSKQGSKL